MEIRQVVNHIMQSNTYILTNGTDYEVGLVDVGDSQTILTYLNPNQIITKVFITHTHYDHIYGLPELLSLFPNCIIYTSEFGKEALKSPKLNLSKYQDDPIICEPKHIVTLSTGDSVEVCRTKLRVIETPGHDRSCLSFIVGNNIFSGDSFIPDVKVLSTLPNSNPFLAMESESILSDLSEGNNLYPGHMQVYMDYREGKD